MVVAEAARDAAVPRRLRRGPTPSRGRDAARAVHSPGQLLRGASGVRHEHRDGHPPYSTWDWRDSGRDFANAFERDVTDETRTTLFRCVRNSVHADVDHDGAWLDHVCRDHLGASCRDDEDVRTPGFRGQVGRAAMTDR